jgi:uncharacterized membrane protein YgcG
MEGVQSVALAQLDFGTTSVKPTRLLLKVPGPLHPRMFTGMPQLDDEGNYLGPLPKMQGTPLIGRLNGEFRTAASASWPPQLCEWVARQFMASFQNSASGKSQLKRERQPEVAESKKRRKGGEEGGGGLGGGGGAGWGGAGGGGGGGGAPGCCCSCSCDCSCSRVVVVVAVAVAVAVV